MKAKNRLVTIHGEELEGRRIVHLVEEPEVTLCGRSLPSQASPDEEPGWDLVGLVGEGTLVCGECFIRLFTIKALGRK